MKRLLQKKILLPIKYKIGRNKRIKKSGERTVKEMWERIEELEKERHSAIRRSDKNKEHYLTGCIETLQWVCQEQNESNQ